MKTLAILTLAVGLTVSSTSFATSINDRQENQRARIAQGIESGEITKREGKKLVQQQQRIAKQEHKFRSDGEFTAKERARVQHNLNKSSGNIYRKKHNVTSRN